jgi:replicative DNA helicase
MTDQLVPPHNVEIEQAILSSCLLDQDTRLFGLVKPEQFYRTAHQHLFREMEAIHTDGQPVDINLLTLNLKHSGKLEQVGGAAYISKLMDVPPVTNDKAYAKRLCGFYKLRKVIEVAHAASKRAAEARPENFAEPIDYVTDELAKLVEDDRFYARSDRVDMSNVYDAPRMVDEYKVYLANLKNNRFITSIDEIDRRIRGIGGGEVLTILARAGSFKTALLQNMLRRYVEHSKWAAVFFSIEMPVASVTERFFEMLDGCTGREVERTFTDPAMTEVAAASVKQFTHDLRNLFIVPTRISLEFVPRYVAMIEKRRNVKIGVIGIDYLGLMDGGDGNEYEVTSKLARGIKQVAKAVNLPVIMLSQVSRKGGDGEIEISLDMGRGSGAIEEGADTVLGLWQMERPGSCMDGEAEYDLICRILKNRKGSKGSRWVLDLNPQTLQLGADATEYKPVNKKRNKTCKVV